MTRRTIPVVFSRRAFWFFALFVLFQVVFLVSLLRVRAEDPFSMLVAGAFAVPVVVAVLLIQPRNGLLLVPFLLVVPGWFFGFTLSEVLLLVTVFLALLRQLASGNRIRGPRPVEVVYFLYVIWAGVSVLQAVETRSAIVGFKMIVMLFVAFVAARRLLGAERARLFVRCVALLGVVVAVQLLVTVMGKGYSFSVLLTRAGRLTDLGWGFSNYVAAVAALTTAASIPLAFHGRGWERILGFASLVSAIVVSLVTVSRGGTIALLAGLLVAAAMELRRRFVVAMVFLAVMASAYLLSPLGKASLDRFVEPQDLPSVAARVAYYRETLRIVGEHRILGVGPSQIPHYSSLYMGPNPHNFLLKNAADLGIPGLGLYLLVLVLVASAGRGFRGAAEPESRLLRLSLVLVLAVGVTNGLYEPTLGGWVYGAVFWMMLGTLYAAGEARRRSKRVPS